MANDSYQRADTRRSPSHDIVGASQSDTSPERQRRGSPVAGAPGLCQTDSRPLYVRWSTLLSKTCLPAVDFLQVFQWFFGDDIELTGVDRSRLAVECEHVALVKRAAAEATVVSLRVDVQLATADDTRLVELASDDGGVGGTVTAGREHTRSSRQASDQLTSRRPSPLEPSEQLSLEEVCRADALWKMAKMGLSA